ncbi:MAG: hypothetical protein ACK5JI_01530, partial [Azonexus sp.]
MMLIVFSYGCRRILAAGTLIGAKNCKFTRKQRRFASGGIKWRKAADAAADSGSSGAHRPAG